MSVAILVLIGLGMMLNSLGGMYMWRTGEKTVGSWLLLMAVISVPLFVWQLQS